MEGTRVREIDGSQDLKSLLRGELRDKLPNGVIFDTVFWRVPMSKGDNENQKRAGISEQQAYDELLCYTLGHGGSEFIHQHVVDAWAAQHADEQTKPIGLAFALIGLYLHVEKGFSGRQVQQVHMKLGRYKRIWPSFPLPSERGSVTAAQVMAVQAGPERDKAIVSWCASVWEAFSESRRAIAELLKHHGIL